MNEFLELPKSPGRLLLEEECLMVVGLLPSDQFARYCRDRDIHVDVDRLARLERLGLFSPIVRFLDTRDFDERLRFPNSIASHWFDAGQAVDSYDTANKPISDSAGCESEAYYSIFQLDDLAWIASWLTLSLNLDDYLEKVPDAEQAASSLSGWVHHAQRVQGAIQRGDFRRALPVLCQYISNRYYPLTQTNRRAISISTNHSTDQWMCVNGFDWDWEAYCREFDPHTVESRFALTEPILKHAYGALASSGYFCDPLENWDDLVSFVSIDQKRRLKGAALRAQSFYDAANLIRFLYRDLYGKELGPPAEQGRETITPFPEYEVRDDARRHLEFVVNRYDLNPQPKLVLFLEGESEIVVVSELLRTYFGVKPGAYGIEFVNLGGVNNATGNRKQDRFAAILRLVDYLNHHQTLSFLILDRENNAEKLKEAARSRKSIHGQARLAIPYQNIRLWRSSLEFDNFSDTELAAAMSEEAEHRVLFHRADVSDARRDKNPGRALSNLYRARTGHSLNKPSLGKRLVACALNPAFRRKPENRPVVRILEKILGLAALNPFPTREEYWAKNQTSILLGGNRRKP